MVDPSLEEEFTPSAGGLGEVPSYRTCPDPYAFRILADPEYVHRFLVIIFLDGSRICSYSSL